MEKILKNKFNIFLILSWLIVALLGMFHHEIWRDEAQVWCLARDLGFLDLLKVSRIEGHPILWYLILFPFAKLHFSVVTMQIIGLLFVFASVCFLIFKSNYNKFQKFIIIFSAGMLYYLPVIVRNYALCPLFIFVLAYLYPKRDEKPFLYTFNLILLANTHLLMFGFCSILSLFFIIEQVVKFFNSHKVKILIPPLLAGLNILYLIFGFMKVGQENAAIQKYFLNDASVKETIFNFSMLFYNKNTLFDNEFFSVLAYLFIFLLGLFLYKYSKKIFTVMLISFFWVYYIYVKVWFGGIQYQKIFLFLLILLFCFWNYDNKKYKDFVNKILNFFFVIGFFISISSIYADINNNFSCSKQTAEFIKNNLNKETIFLFDGREYAIAPLSVYLPDKKFYSLRSRNYLTWSNFSNKNNNKTIQLPSKARYLIIQEDEMHKKTEKDKALIFSSKETVFQNKEFFSIYDLSLY